MKMISWNVNGLRACLKKGFCRERCCAGRGRDLPAGDQDAEGTGDIEHSRATRRVFNSADKKGYSGTARVLPRADAARYTTGHRRGRARPRGPRHHLRVRRLLPRLLLHAQFPERSWRRIDYRMRWEDDFRAYLMELDEKKPVDPLRRSERRPRGDRPEKPQDQPHATPVSPIRSAASSPSCWTRALSDTFRYFYPGRDRRVQLVELHRRRAQPQRGVAHRLFRRLSQRAERTAGIRDDPSSRSWAAIIARWS